MPPRPGSDVAGLAVGRAPASRPRLPWQVAPLLLAALISFGAAGSIPHDGFHPLALLAALLPLQLAALFYGLRRQSG